MAYTYKDIARITKTSPSTISRVVTGKDLHKVSKEKQELIKKVIKKLSFTPNVLARSLRQKKNFNIAVAVKSSEDVTNPYFNRIISGINDVLEKNDYCLQLTTTISHREPSSSPFYLKVIREGRVDGLCLLSEEAKDEDILTLFKEGFPIVLVNRYLPNKDIPSILIDNKAGLYTATKELITLGHRRIAFLAGSFKFQLDKDRLSGYKDALKEANISFNKDLLEEGLFNFNHAYSATERLFTIKPQFTALLASDDVMALAAIRKIQEYGLSVPEDISVIGFNDMISIFNPQPLLTSMRLPLFEIGVATAATLLDAVEKKELSKRVKFFTPELIRRQSIGPCKKENKDK